MSGTIYICMADGGCRTPARGCLSIGDVLAQFLDGFADVGVLRFFMREIVCFVMDD